MQVCIRIDITIHSFNMNAIIGIRGSVHVKTGIPYCHIRIRVHIRVNVCIDTTVHLNIQYIINVSIVVIACH